MNNCPYNDRGEGNTSNGCRYQVSGTGANVCTLPKECPGISVTAMPDCLNGYGTVQIVFEHDWNTWRSYYPVTGASYGRLARVIQSRAVAGTMKISPVMSKPGWTADTVPEGER